MTKKLISFEDTREILDVSGQTLYRYIWAKKIPAIRIGGRWKFNIDKLNRWLDEQEVTCSKR